MIGIDGVDAGHEQVVDDTVAGIVAGVAGMTAAALDTVAGSAVVVAQQPPFQSTAGMMMMVFQVAIAQAVWGLRSVRVLVSRRIAGEQHGGRSRK